MSFAKPRKIAFGWLLLLTILGLLALGAFFVPLRYAYEPGAGKSLNDSPSFGHAAYDEWGVPVSEAEARTRSNDSKQEPPSPARGAVRIDEHTLALGRAAFYTETFGNEVFLTDVLGIIDGPVGLAQYAKALLLLKGRATTNLRVEVAADRTIGGRQFKRGQLLDTGLDVPKG